MNKKILVEAIEAYAAAKSTGNINLLQMSAHALKSVLDQLPEELLPLTGEATPLAPQESP